MVINVLFTGYRYTLHFGKILFTKVAWWIQFSISCWALLSSWTRFVKCDELISNYQDQNSWQLFNFVFNYLDYQQT